MNKKHYLLGFFVIFYTVGLVGLSLPTYRDLFVNLMPLTLIMTFVVMMAMHNKFSLQQIMVFSVVALAGYFIEVVGVATGLIFGEYQYGSALGPSLWGTPPMIGVNWLMLIYCVYLLFKHTQLHSSLQIVFAASLMVVYDIIMEPVAMRPDMDMWSWGGGPVPFQNYLAWFVISLVLLSFMHLNKITYRNPIAIGLFFIQMAFFSILNFSLS